MVLSKGERVETYISIASLTAAAAVFAGSLLFEDRPYHRIFLSSSAIALSTGGLICHNTRGKEARRYSQLAINSQWEKAMILSEHSLEDLYKRLHPRAAADFQDAELIEEMPALPEAENPPLPIDSLLNYPSLGLIGPQGSGKSRLAAEIMLRKGKEGHRLIVLDPHAAAEDWEGLEVIGAGLQYGEIENFIERFCLQIRDEYKKRRKDKNFRPASMTVLCEEMTGWAANVKNSGDLMRVALSDTRKLKKSILVVSHGDTLATLGAPKGMGKAKDDAMAKIVLGVAIDPTTREACPSFEGTLKLPGREPESVRIEKLPPLPSGAFREFAKPGDRPAIDLEKTEPVPIDVALEKIYSADNDIPASALSQAEWELYGLAVGVGSLSVRDAQRSPVARREGWDSDRVKQIFSRFSELGLGSIHHGARDSVEFKVDGGTDD